MSVQTQTHSLPSHRLLFKPVATSPRLTGSHGWGRAGRGPHMSSEHETLDPDLPGGGAGFPWQVLCHKRED